MRIIAIHGWPDTPKLFKNMKKYFKEKNHQFHSIPNYAMSSDTFESGIKKMIKRIDKIYDDSEPIVLIGHDWGALFCNRIDLMYKKLGKPHKISKMVLLDVGTTVYFTSFIKYYLTWQGLGALIYLLGSKRLQSLLTCTLPYPTDDPNRNKIFTKLLNPNNWASDQEKTTKKPTLFMTGSNSYNFYTQEFLQDIQSRKDCCHYEINGGHWFLLEKESETNEKIEAFISKNDDLIDKE